MSHTDPTQRNRALGTAPIGPLLFRLALPTILAQLVNALYNIVDRIYIGHMEPSGDLALTGLGVCFSVIMFISALAALAGSGGGPRAATPTPRPARRTICLNFSAASWATPPAVRP